MFNIKLQTSIKRASLLYSINDDINLNFGGKWRQSDYNAPLRRL